MLNKDFIDVLITSINTGTGSISVDPCLLSILLYASNIYTVLLLARPFNCLTWTHYFQITGDDILHCTLHKKGILEFESSQICPPAGDKVYINLLPSRANSVT